MKRLNDPAKLVEYKHHVDRLAAILLANENLYLMRERVATAVQIAQLIIDEVDRRVDEELERTGHSVDWRLASKV